MAKKHDPLPPSALLELSLILPDPQRFGTLKEAQDQMIKDMRAGTKCPACDRFAKIYPRTFNSGMAVAMIVLCRSTTPGEWKKWEPLMLKAGYSTRSHGLTKHWNLSEQQEKDPENTKVKTSGVWRLTDEGRAFAEGRLSVPQSKLIFRDQVIFESTEKVDIRGALGEKVDYEKLMNGSLAL